MRTELSGGLLTNLAVFVAVCFLIFRLIQSGGAEKPPLLGTTFDLAKGMHVLDSAQVLSRTDRYPVAMIVVRGLAESMVDSVTKVLTSIAGNMVRGRGTILIISEFRQDRGADEDPRRAVVVRIHDPNSTVAEAFGVRNAMTLFVDRSTQKITSAFRYLVNCQIIAERLQQ